MSAVPAGMAAVPVVMPMPVKQEHSVRVAAGGRLILIQSFAAMLFIRRDLMQTALDMSF